MADIDAETVAVVGTIVGAGGIGGWLRERRKGRKDANNFAMEFIKAQSLRIDELVREVAELRADNRVYDATITGLTRENQELRSERAMFVAEIDRLKVSIQELKSAGGQ